MSNHFDSIIKAVQGLAHKTAIKAMESGSIDQYLGNPGIVNDYDQTLLNILIRFKDVERVKILLERGANPNMPNIQRKLGKETYPLQIAFRQKSLQMVKMLLEKGASFELICPHELFLDCVLSPSFECFHYLFENKIITINHIGHREIRSSFNRLTASQRTSEYNNMVAICQFLILLKSDFLDYEVDTFLTFQEGIDKYNIKLF